MNNSKRSWIILFAVLVIVVIAGLMLFGNPSVQQMKNSVAPSGVDANAYQAVFLVNNQVYFGKLSNENSQFPVLTDIYYLQVNQPIQPAQTTKGQPAPAANPAVNLVKLGGELHGPTDEMRINRDQILLVENLRPDSNVTKAIENYKANQQKAATIPAK